MNNYLVLLILTFLFCHNSTANQACNSTYTSQGDFLLSYEKRCYYHIKKESEIINYANQAKSFGFVSEYINILELADKRGSIEATFLIGKFFFEEGQLAKEKEDRLYKLAKGITNLSISAGKGLKKAKEYYMKYICNSDFFKSASPDKNCI